MNPRRAHASDHRGRSPQGVAHAFAIDDDEDQLAQMKVRASRTQVEQLLAWAEPFAARTWAIEGADGMGYCSPSNSSRPASTS